MLNVNHDFSGNELNIIKYDLIVDAIDAKKIHIKEGRLFLKESLILHYLRDLELNKKYLITLKNVIGSGLFLENFTVEFGKFLNKQKEDVSAEWVFGNSGTQNRYPSILEFQSSPEFSFTGYSIKEI